MYVVLQNEPKKVEALYDTSVISNRRLCVVEVLWQHVNPSERDMKRLASVECLLT